MTGKNKTNEVAKILVCMGYDAEATSVTKNGVELEAITIKKADCLGEVHYLAGFGDYPAEWIARRIAQASDENRETPNLEVIEKTLSSWENAKEKVIATLCRNYNEGDVHSEFLDMCIVYRMVLDDVVPGNAASIVVREKMLGSWGITKEELHNRAMSNTERNIISEDMVTRIRKLRNEADALDDVAIFEKAGIEIITNEIGCHGAIGMCFSDTLKKIADKKHDDLYILPSSIHEVIAIAVHNEQPGRLREMVENINDTEIIPEEILSYSVYKYSRDNGTITIA